MDFKNAMKQMQNMQSKIAELQKQLENEIVEGSSGGGMVKVKATCKHEIKEISIDPSLINIDEKEMLEDLIISAINNARKNADTKSANDMQKLTESFGIPPHLLNNLGF